MKKNIFLLFVLICIGVFTNATEKGKQIPYWLNEYKEVYNENPRQAALEWFSTANFGMFVHLNLASLCENGKADYLLWTEGKADDRLLNFVGIDRETYEKTANKDKLLFDKYLLPNFNADEICKVAVAAQMKYINFTTQHLGRCYNFDTKTSEFNSVNAPCGRDLVAEMAKACKKYGLALFLYLPPEFAKTTDDRLDLNHRIIKELLTNYGPIAGIWFDGIGLYYKNPENYTKLSETYDMIRKIQPHCLISFKEGANCEEDFLTPEHFMLPYKYDWATAGQKERWEIRDERWKKYNKELWEKCSQYKLREVNSVMQECLGRDALHVSSGWMNDESARHLTADEVYYWLTYARYCGANLLMNIGPRKDGSMHPDDVKALTEVGQMIKEKGWPTIVHKVELRN